MDGESALFKTADGDILGGQRDMLFDIIGSTTRLVGFSAEVNGGSLYYDGHTPGTAAILQYDGLDPDDTGSPPALINSEGLGGVDLTDNGQLFLFALEFGSIDHPMDLEIDVHSGASSAIFSGTVPESVGTPLVFNVPFWDFTGDDVFGDATSIEFRFNPLGAEDIDFQLNSLVVTAPEPSTMLIWGIGLIGLACRFQRRRRHGR